MSIAVTGYKNIKVIGTAFSPEDWENKFLQPGSLEPTTVLVSESDVKDFPLQAEGVDAGNVYSFDDRHVFIYKSYHAYNEWRDWLSKAIIGESAREVSKNPGLYKDKPCYKLINFTDCEGVIGPVVAEKLAKDFHDNWKTIGNLSDVEGFLDVYKQFQAAFEFVASNGLLRFA